MYYSLCIMSLYEFLMLHIYLLKEKNIITDRVKFIATCIIGNLLGYKISVYMDIFYYTEFLKFIGPRGQKIMRSANNVGNAGPHVHQTFLNDVFTFLTEVGNALRSVNTGTSSVNSEFVTALIYVIFYLFLVNIIGNCHENKYI